MRQLAWLAFLLCWVPNASIASENDITEIELHFGNRNYSNISFTHRTLDRSDGRLASFDHSNLTGIRFREADLRGIAFYEVGLAQADFTNANLSGARFDRSGLRDARFIGARLVGASFQNVDLHGADFSGADLRDIILIAPDLRDSRFDCKTRLPFSTEKALKLGMKLIPEGISCTR